MDTGRSEGTIHETGKTGEQIIGGGNTPRTGNKNSSTPGTGEKTGGTEKGKQGIPKLVMVEDPSEIEVKKETKKSDSKKKKATQLNPKQQKKAQELADLQDTLTLLLKSTFDMVAIRSPIWEVTDEEIKNITGPLTRIIDRHNFAAAANEYGDYVALTLAVGMTVAPRVLLAQEMRKGGYSLDTKRKADSLNNNNDRQENFITPDSSNVKKLIPGLG